MLHRNGWIISSMNPFVNIPDYPQVEVVLDEIWKQNRYITLDADAIAKECGSVKSANIVVLGAASPFLDLKYETLQNAVMQLFASKGDDIVELNLKALQAGKEYALKHS